MAEKRAFNAAAAKRAKLSREELHAAVKAAWSALPVEQIPKDREGKNKLVQSIILKILYERYAQECAVDEAAAAKGVAIG